MKKQKSNRGPKVTSENLPSGRKLPRKPGLTDETKGKAIGARPIKPARIINDYTRSR
jgi:hypothetical protein